MRRSIRMTPLLVAALGAAGGVAASPPAGTTEVQHLRDLASEIRAQSEPGRAAAARWARGRGVPLREDHGGGRATALQFLHDGRPYAYATSNADAADTVSTDEVWPGGAAGLGLNGAGVVVHLWDGGEVRATHPELAGAVTWADDSTPGLSDHATHVAGTLVALGLDPAARGMARGASLLAYDWRHDAAEMALAAASGARLSNHSYGWIRGWHRNPTSGEWYWYGEPSVSRSEDVLFGFYDHTAKVWDEIAVNAPFYLICKSASNDRGDGPEAGETHWAWSRGAGWVQSRRARPHDGGSLGYDTITQQGCAKNILTVGAVDDLPGGHSDPDVVTRTSLTGWGPTDDGRIKPDLVANGTEVWSPVATDDGAYASYSGSSMATPNVTGSLALLIQHYRATHGGADMRSATLKGLALHTADECGVAPGPDYRFGWGLLDTAAAADHISLDEVHDELIQEASLSEGERLTQTWSSDGSVPFKVTVCWTDPPGTPVGLSLDPPHRMLVNDLDVRVIGPDGTLHEPWVLDPAEPDAGAARGDNVRDNVEMVTIDDGPPGDYTIQVTHKGALAGGRQDFALLITRGTGCADCASAPYILWRRRVGGRNTIWYMDGPARLEESGALPTINDVRWAVAGTGDFDGNGRSDILWRHDGTGANRIWLLDGTSRTPVEHELLRVNRRWAVAAVDDFDGDGMADILWRHGLTGGNAVWFMDGAARRYESGMLPPQTNLDWTVAGSGDFDGDGAADILWRRIDVGSNKVWFLDGLVPRQEHLDAVGRHWTAAAVDDFDGDGRADILWRHALDGRNSLWLMDGPARRASGPLPELASPHWLVAGSRDFDRDGVTDVLWRHPASGRNLIWFMDGTLPPDPIEIDAVGAYWEVAGTGN